TVAGSGALAGAVAAVDELAVAVGVAAPATCVMPRIPPATAPVASSPADARIRRLRVGETFSIGASCCSISLSFLPSDVSCIASKDILGDEPETPMRAPCGSQQTCRRCSDERARLDRGFDYLAVDVLDAIRGGA